MATDYVLFIHGVNTREQREQPNYAAKLIQNLENKIGQTHKLEYIPFYWGDVNLEAETKLQNNLEKSQAWKKLWFQDFRRHQLMQFVGDAALYISRQIGSKVVDKLAKNLESQLTGDQSQNRLHLVTHSWGTVILFDVLFAERWEDSSIPGFKSAQTIRELLYGIGPNPTQGIRLASIHTMGSPIALFSLLDVVPGEAQARGTAELSISQAKQVATHDITPTLERLLATMRQNLNGKRLAWRNFIHPGDPVAWPLDLLMYGLVDGLEEVLDLKDLVIPSTAGPLDFTAQLVQKTPIAALLNGGNAHGSYWDNKKVTEAIVEIISQFSSTASMTQSLVSA